MLKLHNLFLSLALLILSPWHCDAEETSPLTDWHKVTTPHVVVYTDYDIETARQVVEKLNVFRSVILQFLKGEEKDTVAPLHLVMFRKHAMWKQDPVSKWAAGYFRFPVYGPLAVVGPDGGKPALDVIYHEYVHYLVNAHVPISYPLWYNEGMAEFFSSMLIGPDYVHIGAVPRDSAKGLQDHGLLNPETLFTQTRYTDVRQTQKAKFYPTAWLTAHYFTLGARNGFPSHYKSNVAFIQKQREGQAVAEAFASSFTISMRDLDKELRQYARSTRKDGFTIDKPNLNLNIETTPLSSPEIKVKLATVFGWQDKDGRGYEYLLSAAQHKAPLALAIRALHHSQDNDSQAADAKLAKLREMEGLDANTLFSVYRANLTLGKHAAEQGDKEKAKQYRQSAQDAFEQSLTQPAFMPVLLENVKMKTQDGDKEAALNAVNRLLIHFGNHPRAHIIASKAYIRLNEVQAAVNSTRRALDLLPHALNNSDIVKQLTEQLAKLTTSLE